MQTAVQALETLVHELEKRWLPPTEPVDDRQYWWSPLPMWQFIPGLEEASIVPPGKFLDVGSGIGSKLIVAQAYGYTVTGLERDPELASISRLLCPTAEILVGDASKFEHYGDYDFVYCYRPFKRDDEEDALEGRIISQLKKGAWLFLPHRSWLPSTERGDMHWMGTPLWRKAW